MFSIPEQIKKNGLWEVKEKVSELFQRKETILYAAEIRNVVFSQERTNCKEENYHVI